MTKYILYSGPRFLCEWGGCITVEVQRGGRGRAWATAPLSPRPWTPISGSQMPCAAGAAAPAPSGCGPETTETELRQLKCSWRGKQAFTSARFTSLSKTNEAIWPGSKPRFYEPTCVACPCCWSCWNCCAVTKLTGLFPAMSFVPAGMVVRMMFLPRLLRLLGE